MADARRPAVPGAITGSASNLADLVRSAAARAGSHTAIRAGAERVTWAELDERVDACAGGLQRLGAVPGDRVAMLLGNGLPFVVGWFGVLRAGLVAVPVNPGYTAPEVSHQLTDSGASVALVEAHLASPLAGALASVPHVVVVGPNHGRSSSRSASGRARRRAAGRTSPPWFTPLAPPAAPGGRCSPIGRCWPTWIKAPP